MFTFQQTNNDRQQMNAVALDVLSPKTEDVRLPATNALTGATIASTTTTTTKASRPPSSCRCSLRWSFLASSALQVIVACLIVWYLGYQSQIDTAHSLALQLRNQTFTNMINQVSILLSLPVLAVTQTSAAISQRLPYENSAVESLFNFGTEFTLWTVLANTLKLYPGTTATYTTTMAGVVLSVVLDVEHETPKLAYVLQDNSTAWRYWAWYSTYNFTTSTQELSNDIDILSSESTYFLRVPTADLTTAKTCCLLLNRSYQASTLEPFYNQTMEHAMSTVADGSYNTAYQVVWILPNVRRTAENIALTIQVAYPHFIVFPQINQLQIYANAALAANSPFYPNLQSQIDALSLHYNETGDIYPVVDFISVVTFNAAVMQDFLLNSLPDFVSNDGAAFILTTNAYLIASTLSNPNISLVLNLTDFFSNQTLIDQINLSDPTDLNYLTDVYDILNSWLAEDNNTRPTYYEVLRNVQGSSTYVQFTSLPTPSATFGFIFILYTQESDYTGNLSENTRNSLLLSLLVLVISLFFTLALVQCIHTPLMTVINAMRMLFEKHQEKQNDQHNHQYVKLVNRQQVSDYPKHSSLFSPSNHLSTSSADPLQSPTFMRGSSAAQPISPAPTSSSSSDVASRQVKAAEDKMGRTDESLSVDELTRLLYKWRSTMNSYGLATPSEWNIPLTLGERIDDTPLSSSCCGSSSLLPQFAAVSRRLVGICNWFSSSELIDLQFTFGRLLYRLRQSQESLDHVSTAKSQFLRFVFHEVRVPLNAVGLGVEQLRVVFEEQILPQLISNRHNNISAVTSGEFTPLELLTVIEDQVSTVARILNDVLSFQRIEEGELQLEMEQFSVAAMIHNTMRAFQSEIKHKQLTLKYEFHLFEPDLYARVNTSSTIPVATTSTSTAVNTTAPPVASSPLIVPSSSVLEPLLSPHPLPDNAQFNSAPLTARRFHSQADSDKDDRGLVVVGDHYRLRQVVSNFVSNAIKFTPANGHIRIEARISRQPPFDDVNDYDEKRLLINDDVPTAESSERRACWLTVSVSDNGVGLTPANIQTLFQPYKQVSPGQFQQGKGSGLGLSICKKLIHMHRGYVNVESHYGSGSTFRFTVPTTLIHMDKAEANVIGTFFSPRRNDNATDKQLSTPLTTDIDSSKPMDDMTTPTLNLQHPLQQSAVTEPRVTETKHDSGTANDTDDAATLTKRHLKVKKDVAATSSSSPELPLLRCLVVEDSEINRKLLVMMINTTRACRQVDFCENGRMCVDLFTAAFDEHKETGNWEPYDIVFLDDHMPVMTGVECVAHLRAMGATVHVYGVTGNALAEDRERFVSAGANRVFTKPVNKALIVDAIQYVRQYRRAQLEASMDATSAQ